MKLTFVIGAPIRAMVYLQATHIPAHLVSSGLAIQLAVWIVHQKVSGRPRGPLVKKLQLALTTLSIATLFKNCS